MQVKYQELFDCEERREFERTIPGTLLTEISLVRPIRTAIDFGCGGGSLAYCMAMYFEDAHVTAYDRNRERIEAIRRDPIKSGHSRILSTYTKPESTFDLVLGSAVLHEAPAEIVDEMSSLMGAQGCLGIVDYDFVGISREEFFRRWGRCNGERLERTTLGDEESYRRHTRFGLAECRELMESRGIQEIFSRGNIQSNFMGNPTTIHFLYLGTR